jgi:hypothetical protein
MTLKDALRPALLALVLTGSAGGCTAFVAGTAAGVGVDEGLNENDGEFDPGENTELGEKIYD